MIRQLAQEKLPLCIVLILAFWGIFIRAREVRNTLKNVLSSESSSTLKRNILTKSAFPAHLYDSRLDSETMRTDCLPKGTHLSQANNVQPDGKLSITVSFMLDFDYCGHAKPLVIYGRRGKVEGHVEGEDPLQFNYTSEKTTGMYNSDFIFHVALSNLTAGRQRYWYKIVVNKDCPTSQFALMRGSSHCRLSETKVVSFWTPPLTGQPTALALIGDLGQTQNSTKTMAHIWRAMSTNNKFIRHPVTQLLIAGDLSYADSDALRWPSWFAIMEPLLRSTLLHVAAGNHEVECNTNTWDIFEPYEHYFRVPNRLGAADLQPISDDYRKTLWNGSCQSPSDFEGHYEFGNSYYSYNHGLARIIVLNSYTDSRSNSTQYKFLERELHLANQERRATPWLIVAFHSPLYTTFLGHVNESEAVRMRASMEPLFLEYKVNFIISGHDHGCKCL